MLSLDLDLCYDCWTLVRDLDLSGDNLHMDKKKWKLNYNNLKGKYLLSPQEQHLGDFFLKSHPKDYLWNWHTNMVTHPSTNRGHCCLTPVYQAVDRSSMPIATVVRREREREKKKRKRLVKCVKRVRENKQQKKRQCIKGKGLSVRRCGLWVL